MKRSNCACSLGAVNDLMRGVIDEPGAALPGVTDSAPTTATARALAPRMFMHLLTSLLPKKRKKKSLRKGPAGHACSSMPQPDQFVTANGARRPGCRVNDRASPWFVVCG